MLRNLPGLLKTRSKGVERGLETFLLHSTSKKITESFFEGFILNGFCLLNNTEIQYSQSIGLWEEFIWRNIYVTLRNSVKQRYETSQVYSKIVRRGGGGGALLLLLVAVTTYAHDCSCKWNAPHLIHINHTYRYKIIHSKITTVQNNLKQSL